MRNPAIVTVVFVVLCVVSTNLLAETFAVQGVLRDPLGKTVADGSYSMTFRLYTTATGGTAVWSETQGSVSVLHGVYNAELGTVTPLTDVAFNTTYYLGLSINGGTELEPRFKLTRSPASMSVLGTDNVFPSKGNVGVGTHTPTAAFHVKNKNDASDVLLIQDSNGNTQVNSTSSNKLGIGTAPAADLHIKTSNTTDKMLIEGSDGTNYVIVDGSGKMGVNVETPAQALDVDGNLKIRSGGIMFDDGSTLTSADMGGSASSVSNQSTTLITADSDENGSGNIDMIIGSTTQMTVNSNGNVGIGTTTTPAYKLDVNGNTRLNGYVGIRTTPSASYGLNVNGSVNFSGNLYQNGSLFKTSKWIENGSNIYYTSGSVGIGTSSSAYKLFVSGSFNCSGSMYNNGYALWSASSSGLYYSGKVGIGASIGSGYINLPKNQPAIMWGTSTYYGGLRWDSSGGETLIVANTYSSGKMMFAIGHDITTNTGSSNQLPSEPELSILNGKVGILRNDPIYPLDVYGQMRAYRYYDDDTDYYIDANTDSYLEHITIQGRYKHSSSFDFYVGSNQVVEFSHGNGTNYAQYDGDSNWDFRSDRRLKENITPETNLLDRVAKLNVVTYNFIDNPNKTKEIGLIAQDVEPYFPSLVSEQDDERYNFKVKALGYTTFGVLAVGAVKELNEKVEDLKEELNKKEAIINDLLKRVEALEKQ